MVMVLTPNEHILDREINLLGDKTLLKKHVRLCSDIVYIIL